MQMFAGSLEVTYLVLVSTCASAVLTVVGLKHGRLLAVFPSLSWLVFMQLPFLIQASGFVPEIAKVQALGIAIIAIFVMAGDAFGLRRTITRDTSLDQLSEPYGLRLMFVGIFMVLIIALPIYHVMHVADIPLLNSIFGEKPMQTAIDREQYDKLLEIPRIFKISFNWVLTVVGPLLIALVLGVVTEKAAKVALVALILAWLSVYAILSTAKQPLLAFIVFAAVCSSPYWKDVWLRVARWAVTASLVLFIAFGLSYAKAVVDYQNTVGSESESYQNLMSNVYEKNDLRGFSIGDVTRLADAKEEPFYLRIPHYLVYRTFFTPVEVAYEWYAYFPHISGDWRVSSEVLGILTPGVKHAANRVGVWAYVERFPEHYLNSASAYASLDADAYSFGGLSFVAVVGLIVFLIRIIVTYVPNTTFGRAAEALLTCHLGMFCMSASVQAILVAQGAGLIVMMAILLAFLSGIRPGQFLPRTG